MSLLNSNLMLLTVYSYFQLTGSKAPQLKRLAQWLLENPMFDVDPKWAELVKERGNLPHDLQKRLPQSERKKGPGRPPLLSSPPGQQNPTSQASSLPTSNLPFPSLASAGLAGINPSTLLSGLSLGGFDPKNNPLLLPFGGMPNMSALGGMSGLGNMNLTNSLFANLAGLGLPSLAGMDSSLTDPVTSSAGSSSSKAPKPRKPESSNSSKTTPVSSASSSLPSSLPFFFPNPSLLYTPLGLGGLNPFSLQPGSLSSAYDSLALLNGGLGVSTASQVISSQGRPHKTTASTSTTAATSSATTTIPTAAAGGVRSSSSSSSTKQRSSATPTQFLLPHDTHLLESLTRATAAAAASKSRHQDSRRLVPPSPSASPLPFASKTRDQEMKEALEALSKSSAELFARIPQDDRLLKRSRDEAFTVAPVDLATKQPSPSPPVKKVKESPVPSPAPSKASNCSSGLDLSSHGIVEEREKTLTPAPTEPQLSEEPVAIERLPIMDELSTEPQEKIEDPNAETQDTLEDEQNTELGVDIESLLPPSTVTKSGSEECTEESSGNSGKGKKRRGKKSPGDVVQRKMLRSSAGRAAAAAARAREEQHSN